MYEVLEHKLKYSFKNKQLLITALTHPSVNSVNYERLEFLGDAVLELSVSELLYKLFPAENEGFLTKLRSQIVCSASLVKVAQSIEIGKYLILSASEDNNNGRHKKSILENVVEAILGAIYLDSDFPTASSIIQNLISVKNYSSFTDYKSLLQEYLQANHINDFGYVLLSETGPDHKKFFECGLLINGILKSKGQGFSKKEAEKDAAKKFLIKRSFNNNAEF